MLHHLSVPQIQPSPSPHPLLFLVCDEWYLGYVCRLVLLLVFCYNEAYNFVKNHRIIEL